MTTKLSAYTLKSGYAFQLDGRQPFRSQDERWDIVCQNGNPHAHPIGKRTIDGSECIIFRAQDGRYFAQTTISCRN